MNYLMEGSSVFADIKNWINMIGKELKPKNKKPSVPAPYLGGSITQATKDLIMSFPMLSDNSLSVDTISMVGRANERYLVSLMQLYFASNQIKAHNGLEAIKLIHNNIKANLDIDDYIDICNNIAGAYKENSTMASEVNRAIRVMNESLKNRYSEKSYPISSFSERALTEYNVQDIYGKKVVMEADPYDFMYGMNANAMNDPFTMGDPAEALKQNLDIDKMRNQQIANTINYINGQNTNANAKRANAINRARLDLDQRKFMAQQNDFDFTKQLVDSDVRKANELQPSLLILKYTLITDDNGKITENPIQQQFIAGVKSRIIPVDSMDIIERLIAKDKNRISFLNFIRATTGEIKFVRDFLLSMKQAKIDSKNSVKKGANAKIWKTLEFRATKNNKNKNKSSGNDASAITTLVVSQEIVNYMRKEYEFDLERLDNTKLILDAYNFMGIVICDESLKVAKSYYAGYDMYEQQAYSYLQKESNDKSYKEVINLIGKMNK